jgi:hypothetical protein
MASMAARTGARMDGTPDPPQFLPSHRTRVHLN